jgi:hypothetical protein
MYTSRFRAIVPAALAAVFFAVSACGLGAGLKGTTWDGGNMVNHVQISFTGDAACSVQSSFYTGPCSYTASNGQVSVKINGTSYVLTQDGDRMTGAFIFNLNVSLAKQR